jgi:hypothetical protein
LQSQILTFTDKGFKTYFFKTYFAIAPNFSFDEGPGAKLRRHRPPVLTGITPQVMLTPGEDILSLIN